MLAACAAAVPYTGYATNALEVTDRAVPVSALPSGFAGLRICHLSDLHMQEFGERQQDLVVLIRDGRPDIIAITGDMVNRGERDEGAFLSLCDQLPEIAPTYFVTGNHEWSGLHDGIETRIARRGVHFMDNRHVALERNGDTLYLAGAGEWREYRERGVTQAVRGIPIDGCVVLLAHHPEYMSLYAAAGMNLVLAGHTHGGQIRIPFLGSLLVPDQTYFFPRYDCGLFRDGTTAMYISRGLGLSFLPVRINCPREVAFLTLE